MIGNWERGIFPPREKVFGSGCSFLVEYSEMFVMEVECLTERKSLLSVSGTVFPDRSSPNVLKGRVSRSSFKLQSALSEPPRAR